MTIEGLGITIPSKDVLTFRARNLALLVGCGLASSLIYLAAFTLPYPLATGLERPLQHFGHLSGPSVAGTIALAGALAALFMVYLLGIHLCTTLEGSRAALLAVYGTGGLAAAALLWMYPLFSLDVFYYMAADRIWTVFGENPFVVPPLQAAHDPFFPYTRWGHYPLPYGPLWPWISAATSGFGMGEVQTTLVAFKALSVVGYLVCVPLVAWAVRQVRPDRLLTGCCIFAWNPLVILEWAGSAHNDAIALAPVALAVGLWARRSSAAAAASLAVSLLVKATAILVVPAFMWASALRAAGQRRLPRWLVLHGLPGLAIGALAWLPFWHGRVLLSQLSETGQYYQTITALVAAAIPPASNPVPVGALQVLLVGGFALAYFSQLGVLSEEGRPALRAIWGLTIVYFLVVSPFYSAWYMAWPTLYAATLAERRITLLTTLLCAGSLGTYLIQFVARPALNLGWAQSNALGLLAVSGPFLFGWVVIEARRRKRVETLRSVAAATAPGGS